MNFINEIMSLNYFFAVIINFLIGFALYMFLINQKKENPNWEIPKEAFGVIATFFIFGLIPELNKLLLILSMLFIFYIIAVFILTLVIFELKTIINRFLLKK